jgi:GT2 family glycosyltransferase
VKASIVVPAKNEAANLPRLLDAVFSQRAPWPFEVIVIDSGSTDGSQDVVRRSPARLVEIRPKEFNHGATRNLGCREARGEILVCLVADALPANRDWLATLVENFDADPRVAGVYSRQLPREGAGPIERRQLLAWMASSPDRRVAEIASPEAFAALTPHERRMLANFDDVSSARRRSVWEEIPIAENLWAEDVDWSRKAILAGHRIVFEPRSLVFHSHRPTVRHTFRRLYLDQWCARDWFGLVYFPTLADAIASFRHEWRENVGAVRGAPIDEQERFLWETKAPFLAGAGIVGAALAAHDPYETGGRLRLLPRLPRARIALGDRTSVYETVFTVCGDPRPTLLVHPVSEVRFRLRVPRGATLRTALALNPDVWTPDKGAGVTFSIAAIAGRERLELCNCFVDPKSREADRRWHPVEIDLAPLAGRTISLALRTEAADTRFGWAGFADPTLVSSDPPLRQRLLRAYLRRLRRKIAGSDLRHP